jgi:hypothetical protein
MRIFNSKEENLMNLKSEPPGNSTGMPAGRLMRFPRYRVSILSFIGLLFLVASSVMAQTGLSVLRGTVNDQSGAVLPGTEYRGALTANRSARPISGRMSGGSATPVTISWKGRGSTYTT